MSIWAVNKVEETHKHKRKQFGSIVIIDECVTGFRMVVQYTLFQGTLVVVEGTYNQ